MKAALASPVVADERAIPVFCGRATGADAPKAFVPRLDIGRRNEIGTEQVGELFGVDAVILVLAPVNGFDVKSVGQDEFEAGGLAGIGLPVPAEPALAANGQLVPVGLDQLEEEGEVVVFDVGVDQFFALAIHDADVHLASVQIDSAVELGGGGVILHS